MEAKYSSNNGKEELIVSQRVPISLDQAAHHDEYLALFNEFKEQINAELTKRINTSSYPKIRNTKPEESVELDDEEADFLNISHIIESTSVVKKVKRT